MPPWLETTIRLVLIVGLPLVGGLAMDALFFRLRRRGREDVAGPEDAE